MVKSLKMKMHIYVPDNYYGHMLDNTLIHIHKQSCGFTMSFCMTCRNMIMPKSLMSSMEEGLNKITQSFTEARPYESFFFVMCASCRTDVQKNTGRIPSRGKQRNMIEAIIKESNDNAEMDRRQTMNPNKYANIYVLSVENGVEIILIFGEKPT